MSSDKSIHPLCKALTLFALFATAASLHTQQTATSRTERTQHFLQQRPSTNRAAALLKARAQSRALPAIANLTTPWQPLGPSSIVSPTFGNLTGRITALATDPNDATGNTLYVGSTGGGVWKSTNAAGPLATTTFAPLTDAQPSLSIGALAVQPTINPIVLAGTGDPNDATDSYYGEGILRSTDSGNTWTLIPNSHDGTTGNHSFAGLATAGLAFSTATPTLAVAAFSTSPQASVVSATDVTSVPGLYYSIDAGSTWQMSTVYDGTVIVQRPEPFTSGNTGNAATSVVWDALRQRFYAALRNHGYYSSPDGATWTRLTSQPGAALTTANCPAIIIGTSACPIFRGALAVQPATGDLYAITVDTNDNTQGLWQDLCLATSNACSNAAPTFSTRIDNTVLNTNATTTIAQGSYNLALSAAPAANNSTLLFAGTIDLYRCSLTANTSTCTLRNATNALDGCNAPAAVAPAQHALAAITQSSGVPILYLGNDGGLWRSLDGVAETGSVCSASDITHFDNLNAAIGTGGSLAEVVNFAQDPVNPNTLLAGLGANGSATTIAASSLSAWPQLSAGEGGYPQLDPNITSNWFLAIGAGVNIASCPLGTSCTAANFVPPATIGAAQVAYDAGLLDAPTLLDPALTTNLIAATCRVWRGPAISSATWSSSNAISPAFDGSKTPCTSSSPLIRSIAAGGPNTTSTSAQSSGSTVLYAGLAGALDGGATIAGHIFITTTANTAPTWSDIALSPVTNDLPYANVFNPGAFDISSITVDPHDATGATVYATIMGFGYPHLYRSADFGAHWLDLSANLPDTPANALVVDPNDANTVYVALDTGIYVTQAITTCSTTNCWSLLGTALPDSPVVALAAEAGLPTGAGTSGLLRAGTYGRGLWQIPLLTATSLAQPALKLSASILTFAAQQVSTQSTAQTLTLTSSGNAPVTISSFSITGDFTETDNCRKQILPANATCTVQIVFAPSANGTRTGQLAIYANIPTGRAVVALSGTGTAAASIVLTPTSLTFAANTVNQSDPSQIITVANLGGTTAALQTPAITGSTADFAITANTCTATLLPSTACAIAITFTPTATGARNATLSITDSAGTQTATLSGSGTAPATDTISTNALTFVQQQLNTTSPAQQVTLTNAGGVALTLISASVTPGDFAIVNACGNSLAASSTCAISVTFTPTATGTRSATLTLTDQFRTQTITLTGTGVAPPGVSLSPVSLNFPATGVTLVSPAQTLTLTNNGGLPLTISNITISSGFAIATNNCGNTLAVNAACSLAIVFAPTAGGSTSGTITLTTNAVPVTQTATLTGTGIDFTLASTGPTTATLASGSTAVYLLQLSSLATLSGNVALACAGAPTNSTCTLSPPSATLGNTTPITVTIVTATTLASRTPMNPTFYLALLLPFTWLARRRTNRRYLATDLCIILLLASSIATITGCATNRTVPPTYPNNPSHVPTPSGNYNIAVSATSAGLTHNVGLTLTVQ